MDTIENSKAIQLIKCFSIYLRYTLSDRESLSFPRYQLPSSLSGVYAVFSIINLCLRALVVSMGTTFSKYVHQQTLPTTFSCSFHLSSSGPAPAKNLNKTPIPKFEDVPQLMHC